MAHARVSWCAAWWGGRSACLWPELPGARVLGLGYAVPFLGLLAEASERVCAIMPPAQGVAAWPPQQPNQVALAMEGELPLPDRSIDRVLMVHALESAEQVRPLLREVWRVLVDGGQAMIVVPNRRGLWCLSETTPFGHGQPFSVVAAQGGAAQHAVLARPQRDRALRAAVAIAACCCARRSPGSGSAACAGRSRSPACSR